MLGTGKEPALSVPTAEGTPELWRSCTVLGMTLPHSLLVSAKWASGRARDC